MVLDDLGDFGFLLGSLYVIGDKMYLFGKKKIKICEMDGRKLDSATISNEKEAEAVFKRWKKKGLM